MIEPLSGVYVVRAPAGGGRKFSRCRLDISVGQPYHEGEKFKAAVDWVNRYAEDPFVRCDVVVVDTLQRHTMAGLGADPAAASVEARLAGDEWILRHRDDLATLTMPWRIVRWDELLGHPRLPAMRARLGRLTEAEPNFRAAISTAGTAFVARIHARGIPVPDDERLLRCSCDYLLEEMAVIAVLQEERPAVDCYPGSWRPFEAIRTGVPGLPEGLRTLEWVQLRLKRRPATRTDQPVRRASPTQSAPRGG